MRGVRSAVVQRPVASPPPDYSIPTLSLPQPWAGLIARGACVLANREVALGYRGALLIHASQEMDERALFALRTHRHPVTNAPSKIEIDAAMLHHGGVIGAARLTSCVRTYQSDWFLGPFGLIFTSACELPFTPCYAREDIFDLVRCEPRLNFEMILSDLKNQR